jgi:hypothetical protein
MRYVIKTKDPSVFTSINAWKENGKLEIVEQGDVAEAMKERLDSIKASLDALKKSGISRDLMISHLKVQTGLPYDTINKVLNAQADFFIKLGIR